LAVKEHRDGSMLMGDEQNGIIYRISHVP